jgi:hypothetical protein
VNLDGYAIPVKKLKGTDPVKTLDLSGKYLGVASAVVIASLISVNGGLNKISLAKNKLGEEGIKAICEALEQNKTLKELDISGDMFGNSNIGGTAGVKHVAKMLGVNGALTKLSLAKNKLWEEGTKFLCDALVGNNTLKELDLSGDSSFGRSGSNIGGTAGAKHVANMLLVNGGLTIIGLSGNQLCGIWIDHEGDQQGTYTAEGITAIADALRVNGGLTRVDVRNNNIAGDGAEQLAAAVLGNLKIEMFNEIPIKEMRANSLTELDLNGKDFGVEGGMVVAGLIPVMGGLTSLDLSNNALCGVVQDPFGRISDTYTAEGLSAIMDSLRVNGALTKIE